MAGGALLTLLFFEGDLELPQELGILVSEVKILGERLVGGKGRSPRPFPGRRVFFAFVETDGDFQNQEEIVACGANLLHYLRDPF